MLQYQQSIEQSEGDGRNHEQVHRRDAVNMIMQERPPTRRWRAPTLCHVSSDRGLPDIDAELEELTVDARGAPERIRDAHVANEQSDLMRRARPATARSRFPTPIGSETGAVPADHCARPNHCQCVKCCGYQPRQQNEQQAIDVAQCRSVRRFAPKYIDLVAKNQDLRFTPCAGAQQPNERSTKQPERLNHRPRASPDSRRFARYRVSDKDSCPNLIAPAT